MSRYAARRRDLASSDIFGAMTSPVRTARQERAEQVPDKSGAARFDPSCYAAAEAEGRTARGKMASRDGVGSLLYGGGHSNNGSVNNAQQQRQQSARARQATDPVDRAVRDVIESVSPGRSTGLTESALASVPVATSAYGSPGDRAFSVAAATQATRESSHPGQETVPTRNPLMGDDNDPALSARTQRRMVPSYFDRKEDRPRRKGGRPELDRTAAGGTTEQRGRHADEFRPGHRIVRGPVSREAPADPPRQKKPAPAEGHHRHAPGNPILQVGSDRFERPGTARSGIRVFPDRASAEQRTSTRPEDQERPASSYRRGGARPADHNPILGTGGNPGECDGSLTRRTEGRATARPHHADHDDVIAHRYSAPGQSNAGEANPGNFKVGDSIRNQTPAERLDACVASRLEARKTFILNRAKVETSSDALRNFIYDNPAAIP